MFEEAIQHEELLLSDKPDTSFSKPNGVVFSFYLIESIECIVPSCLQVSQSLLT